MECEADEYRCPQGHALRSKWRLFKNERTHVTQADTIIYRASQHDCANCPMKQRCCPNTPMRKIARSIHALARDVARQIENTEQYERSRNERKKVEMLFAEKAPEAHPQVSIGCACEDSAAPSDEFTLAATVQQLAPSGQRYSRMVRHFKA